MRFTPYSFDDVSSSEDELITETEDETNFNHSTYNANPYSNDSDSTSSVNETTSLSDLLENLGLEKRFNLVSSIYKKNEELEPFENASLSLITTPDSSGNSDASQTQNMHKRSFKITDPTQFITSEFLKRRQQNNDEVDHLIKAEEERIRLIEEERQRKIAEERKRKEEEDRRIREEKERKIKEEAERKRLEEEKQRKDAEEERLRREQREKEMKEKLAKERELKKLKEKQDAELRAAEEAKRVAEEAKNSIYKPREIEQQFLQYVKHKEQIETNILVPVAENKELKKLVGSHKRKINPKFGQLTNSQEQLTRITGEIKVLVDQTQGNNLAHSWILNFVADAIIAQAETEVSVKPKSSIPLAKLSLNLMILYPELSQLLLTKFYTKCPLLIGYSCTQTTEEGRVRMGWNRDEDTGKWEKESSYNERLSGISTFYAVINRLKLDGTYLGFDPSSMKHPLPISNSWVFLARMMDLPESLLTEIHYVIVGSWWDACCKEFIEAYGKQARKLLNLVSTEWTSIGNKSSAGRVRIRLLFDELSKGVIESFPLMER